MEHKGAVDKWREEDSDMAKHMSLEHRGEEPVYKGRVVGGSLKNLERYVMESLFIEKTLWRL